MKVIGLILALTSFQVLACGGEPISEATIKSSPITKSAQLKLEAAVGEELVLTVVKLSGNDILDIDMKPVASARCAANYISIYYKSARDPRVTCYASGEVNAENKYELTAGKCRLANKQFTGWIRF